MSYLTRQIYLETSPTRRFCPDMQPAALGMSASSSPELSAELVAAAAVFPADTQALEYFPGQILFPPLSH